MNNILIIGAGRSSGALIRYLLEKSKERNWFVTVADADPKLAEAKIGGHPNGRAVWLDATKTNDRRELITRADVVVSLLPAFLHLEVAYDCIRLRKHLINASYVSREMYSLADEARSRELLFMGEMGLDPGIDHMSAMQKIDEIRAKGGKITTFRSYTGGLVAPESDNNPWHYKFTWNPRNVVLAGQGTAQYLEDGKLKFIPYNRLFAEIRSIQVPGMGEYEVYANRDSLMYVKQYGLEGTPSVLRGTVRHKGFCSAWNALVKIGMTDGEFPILNSDNLTYHELMEAFAPVGGGTVKERIAALVGETPDSAVMSKLEWLGLFRKTRIRQSNASPASILENILLDKWRLEPTDKDMIIMQHEFEYVLDGKQHRLLSTMVMKGENEDDTAMSRLVGLPLGIFVRLVMEGAIHLKGVQIPVMKEVYEPVLAELAQFGVTFHEEETIL